METESRLRKIKNAILRKPFLFSFIFLFYIFINIFLNQTYTLIPMYKNFAKTFLIPYLFFNFLLIPFLVALTINLTVLKFKELKTLHGGFASGGIFAGVLGGACPGCFAGLFPAFLGLFGITATLGNLPLFGLEIQILSFILLSIAIIFLTRDLKCEIPFNKKDLEKIKKHKKQNE